MARGTRSLSIELQVEAARWRVQQQFLRNIGRRADLAATTTTEGAREFTGALLDAARTILAEEPRGRRMREWCEHPETKAKVEAALAKRCEACRAWKGNRTPATWRILRTARRGAKAAIEEGINAHFERYAAKLEAIYRTAT